MVWQMLAIFYAMIAGTAVGYFWINEYISLESKEWSDKTKRTYTVLWHIASVLWLLVVTWYAITTIVSAWNRDMDAG